MVKRWLSGSDQSLKCANLIGKASLNFLQAGGGCEIIAVEEKRSHFCHEHIGFTQDVAGLRTATIFRA